MSNKVVKSVSFNVTNSEDVMMLEYLEGKVFSGYVKELIVRDMRRQAVRTVGGGLKVVVV